jgi:tetratricopeptide (TPR) repeat protein
VHRYRAGEPIVARPAGLIERGVKYTLRRPWVVAAWGATAAALLSTLGAGGYYLYRQNQDLQAELKYRDEQEDKRIRTGLLLREGHQALQEEAWPRAKTAAEAAVRLVGEEPGLEDLGDRAKNLLADATRIQSFLRLCRKVQDHEMLALEEGDRAQHLQAIREAASQAAALIGLNMEGNSAPEFDDSRLPEVIRRKLRVECYQLLFPWSSAVAQEPAQTVKEHKEHATEALRILDRAQSLGLVTRAYSMRRAQLLEKQGDAAGAERERQKARDTEPTLAVDFFLLGMEAKAKTPPDLKGEASYLKQSLQREPRQFWANYYLAANILRDKELPPSRALEPLKVCVDLEPDSPWPYILRGLTRGLLGDFEEALADFGRAEQGRPEPLVRYGILVNRGVVRIKQGELDLATADFLRAAELRPSQWQSYADLAETYSQLGRADDAFAQLKKAIQLKPSAALHRTRARLHLTRDEFLLALPDLEEAIRREPVPRSLDLASDHLWRGKILYRYGKYADALAAFDAAAAVLPPPRDGQKLRPEELKPRAEVQQLRAEALIELSRFTQAIAAVDEAARHGPPTAQAHRARGLAQAKLGNYAAAIEDYTQAMEIDRRARKPDPLTLAYRGWAYLIHEAPKLALADFDEALKLEGCDRVDCCNGRGYARVLLGQWKEAVADAEEALKDKPGLARHCYNAARIYAQAAGKVDADARSSPYTQELRRHYEDRALGLLRQACEKSPIDQRAAFWKEYVQADPALRAVRRSPVYAHLAAEYGRMPK